MMKDNKFEKIVDLCGRILVNCRNELYRYFPFMDGAFASLEYEAAGSEKDAVLWTDGDKLFFNGENLAKVYIENPSKIKRTYLHMLLHCLYLHIFYDRENEQKRIWNLACDIAVEQMIELEAADGNINVISLPENEIRSSCFEIINAQGIGRKGCSAELIYQMLLQKKFPYSMEEMESVFRLDAHENWDCAGDGERAARLRKKWERVFSYTSQNKQAGQNQRGSHSGDEQEQLDELKYGRYDYRKYLKKFAIPREEVELDMESFDYIFYHYGMEHYGNMPLIEPLEYKEVNRLEELVIAIDTSGSCTKEMVQKFLDETYRIFSEKENFFRKMKVHILQCDCHLMDVKVIHSEEEWKEYSKNIVIQGRSGTNFKPVFQYVKEQRAKKEIKNLKALIYFTDGDGAFPEQTDYETIFVFVKECKCMDLIPKWITKLLIYQ